MRTTLLGLVLVSACTANDDVHAPHLATVQPDRAAPGAQVQLDGNYFCGQPEPEPGEEIDPLRCDHVGSVLFDTTASVTLAYTDTSVTAEVPELPPGSVEIRVSVAGRTSNAVRLSIE